MFSKPYINMGYMLFKNVLVMKIALKILLYLSLAASPLASSGFAAIGDWKGLCPFQTSIF